MSVSVESVGAGSSTGNGSSINWSHTIGGSNRHVIIGIGLSGSSVSTVTVGATSCSLITSSNVGTGSENVELWETDSEPATGANTVTVTTGAKTRMEANSINFQGVDTTGPTSGIQTNTGTSTSSNVTVTSSAGDMVTDVFRCDNDPTQDASQALQWNITGGGKFTEASTEAGAASVAMDWTFASTDFAHAGINLNAAAVTRRVFVSKVIE
jgi:hypothetical protein